MSNDWLPGKPEGSTGGKYFKLKDVATAKDKTAYIRILCPFIGGWEAWDTDTKPHRFTTKQEVLDAVASGNLALRVEANKKNPKQFWASFVWNEAAGVVQVWSFTQVTVFTQLEAIAANKKLGQLDAREVSITVKGSGTDTEYTVMPCDKEPISDKGREAWAAVQETAIGLDALYHGGDPFSPWTDGNK